MSHFKVFDFLDLPNFLEFDCLQPSTADKFYSLRNFKLAVSCIVILNVILIVILRWKFKNKMMKLKTSFILQSQIFDEEVES